MDRDFSSQLSQLKNIQNQLLLKKAEYKQKREMLLEELERYGYDTSDLATLKAQLQEEADSLKTEIQSHFVKLKKLMDKLEIDEV